MKRIALAVLSVFILSVAAFAQEAGTTGDTAKSRPKIFRANKAQINEVQTKLRSASLYSGEATGKLDKDTRAAIKQWQGSNGLKQTGTLNRATLEKMGIELTESQKQIPVSENSFASADKKDAAKPSSTTKAKRVIFRATKDQIAAAQDKLRSDSHYTGESTGKLDTATRAGLKKFQTANGLKATGTLNQVTLEKMGIELTDKQKENAAASPSK